MVVIIRKFDDYFLIKVFKNNLSAFNIFDINDIKELFKNIFQELSKRYDLHGLIDADVYINEKYGLIIEMIPIESDFDDIDMRINFHLCNCFLVNIDSSSILDYDEVYYYDGKFYGTFSTSSDSDILYKNTNEIINNGIKVC